MKKLIILFTVFLSSLASWAYDFEVGGIYYEVDLKTMTACVKSGAKKYSGDIVIPETFTVSGRTFTITGVDGFKESEVTSVLLPPTIETIYDNCFYGCKLLTEIDTRNATTIGKSAYENCTGIQRVVIGEKVTIISDRAFYGCTALRYINYNAQNAKYYNAKNTFDYGEKNSIFVNTGKEMDLIVGNKVKRIPNYLFGEDSGAGYSPIDIKNIYFESGSVCEEIGYRSFLRCDNLTYIEIPPTLTHIDMWAFLRSNKVEKVMISDLKAWMNIKFESYSNPINSSPDSEKPADLYLNGQKLETIIIPEGTVIRGASPIPGNYKKVIIPEDFAFESSSAGGISCTCDSLIIKGGWDNKTEDYSYSYEKWRFNVKDYLELPQDMQKFSVKSFATLVDKTFSSSSSRDIYTYNYEVLTKTVSISCSASVFSNLLKSDRSTDGGYSWIYNYNYKGANPERIILCEKVEDFSYLNISGATNLKKIECYSQVPPKATGTNFSKNQLIYTKLCVPLTAIEAYKTAEVWQDFWNIEALENADSEDDISTAIKDNNIERKDGYVIYNLNGVCIMNATSKSELNNLPKGIYIVNGRKTIVK